MIGSDSTVLIHIGFHKTGTTFLQKNIFFCLDQGFCCPWTVDSGEAIEHFVLTHPCRFDAGKIRKKFFESIHQGGNHKLIPTISHEDLSGHPVKGKYYEFEVVERIKQVFPHSKILIVVREQQSMIRSFYNQYVVQGGEYSIKHFVGDDIERPGFSPIFRLDHLEYNLLVEKYISYFGVDSVLVLPREILSSNQFLFLQKFYDFIGNNTEVKTFSTAANVSMGAATVELRRLLNSLPGNLPPLWEKYDSTPILWRAKNRFCRYIDMILPSFLDREATSYIKKAISDRVGSYYSTSNQRLQQYVDFDLSQLGYK
ncbi:MAG: hypothetical protein AAF215_16680 [Cyanobacteria bacterium P01_A01_bin.123]